MPEQPAEVLGAIQHALKRSSDVVFRQIDSVTVIYVDGLVDARTLNEFVLAPLQQNRSSLNASSVQLPIGEIRKTDQWREAVEALLSGDAVLAWESEPDVLLLNVRGWEKRGVQEPHLEVLTKGPRDSFTESLRTNTALVRRRVKDPHVRVESLSLGVRSRTSTALLYIEDVADPQLVDSIRSRLNAIDLDSVLDAQYVAEYFQQPRWTPFPLVISTERPDRTAAALLEGRVAVLVDNSPFAVIVPVTLPSFLISTEDYYHFPLVGSTLRWVRWTGALLTVFLPALYVVVTAVTPTLLPGRLLATVLADRERVPYPALFEVLLMQLMMAVLVEASARLPRAIGPAATVVGGLIIGEAAARAGLISHLMIIVVAILALGAFAVPDVELSFLLRVLQWPMVAAAAFFGTYGITLMTVVVLFHLASLRSCGVPYLAPLAPGARGLFRDTLWRVQWPLMSRRPEFVPARDRRRRRQP